MFRTLSFAIVASTLLASSASASPPRIVCDTTDSIASQLSDRYAEAQVWWTVAKDGKQLAQVYASRKGTWSWVVSVPSGKSCIVAAGKGWQNAPIPMARGS